MSTVYSKEESLSHYPINNGWLSVAQIHHSPHFEERNHDEIVSLLVIHNISLPPGNFGGPHITNFFMGKLDPHLDPYFEDIYQMRVSAHCLIKRTGEIVQFVSFDNKAWHAGVSVYQGREKCNDFSIGIEMEGTDDVKYTDVQYKQLARVTASLVKTYPNLANNIVGHSDIAPGRKTDPGESFDWKTFRQLLSCK